MQQLEEHVDIFCLYLCTMFRQTCLNIYILNDFWMFNYLNKLHALFYYFIIVYKCLASFIYNVNKVRRGLKETLWSCIICLNIWSHNSNGCLFTVVNTVWVIMSSNKVCGKNMSQVKKLNIFLHYLLTFVSRWHVCNKVVD